MSSYSTSEKIAPAGGTPLVGVVMGSDSDLPVVEAAFQTLNEFSVPFEARILSAHRAPDDVAAWARGLKGRGVRVVIAAAGGAAHLGGVVASFTPLPVIGLPVRGKALDGMDALLSMVQMPPGVPVAVVAVDGARNAALLAVQILATGDAALAARLDEFRRRQTETVRQKDARLREDPAGAGDGK